MYVQYAPPGAGGMAPNGYYQGGGMGAYNAPMQGAVGSSGGFFPQMQQQQQYSSRAAGAFGQAPPVNMFQTPRDPYAMPGMAQGYQSGMPPAQDGGFSNGFYNGGGASQQQPAQQQSQQPQHPPDRQPQQQMPSPQQQRRPDSAPQTYGAPPPSQAAPAARGAAVEEPDPDDDPNRLPTFVKVRGVPQQFDPRIEKRPTNKKKRAPHVCCA